MMSENQTTQAYPAETGRSRDFDAIVVGAGFAGLYMLHSLRKLGLSVRVSNMPVVIEQNVEWIADVIRYMRAHDLDVAEPTLVLSQHEG